MDAKIYDPNGLASDGFGNSISLSGDRFVVGCGLCGNTNVGSAKFIISMEPNGC